MKQSYDYDNNNNDNHLVRGTIRLHQRVDTPGAGPFSLHGRNSNCIHVKETTHTQLSQPDAVRPPSPLTGGIHVQNMAYDTHRHELLIRSVNYFPIRDSVPSHIYSSSRLEASMLVSELRPACCSQGWDQRAGLRAETNMLVSWLRPACWSQG